MKQDYVLKKHVKAESIEEALRLAEGVPVTEVYLAGDKPEQLAAAIGFQVPTDTGIPYELRRKR